MEGGGGEWSATSNGSSAANKSKVRPVLDFQEMNGHISCYTDGEMTDIHDERLCVWIQSTKAAIIVNLKLAYLQLHLSDKLWQY